MSKQWDPSGIFEVLASKESRQILAAASVRPLSAKEFETLCDASLPTIYRRLAVLVEYDLLSEQSVVDPEKDHAKQYATDLQEITVTVADGDLSVNVELTKDTVDKFGALFRDLSEGNPKSVSSTVPDVPGDSPTEE